MARVMAALLWWQRSRVQAKQPPLIPCFLHIQMGSQPGTVTARIWAPDSLLSFPVVFQSRTWSWGFVLLMLCSGFGFLGKELGLNLSAPKQGGGEQVLRIFCRQVPNTHWKLHVSSSYWNCSAQTAVQDIDNSCCKDTARMPFPARMRAFTSAQRVVSCFKMTQKVDLKWSKWKEKQPGENLAIPQKYRSTVYFCAFLGPCSICICFLLFFALSHGNGHLD